MGSWSWQRIGAVAGILWFATFIGTWFTPSTPDAEDPPVQIALELAQDVEGLRFAGWLIALGAVFFVIFSAALWSRLRAAETERGPSVLVALGGMGSALIIFIEATVNYALTEAVQARRDPAAVIALFELEEIVFVGIFFTAIIFYAGVALCERGVRTLPAWAGIGAAILTLAFVVGSIGLATTSDDGGAFGAIGWIGLLVNFIWVLAVSIWMLRDTSAGDREQVTVVAP